MEGLVAVRLFEYQGKTILKSVGIPIPLGEVASNPEEAQKIAERIGKPVAVKAQVWAGGRFKAGGIKFAENPAQAKDEAASILSMTIKGLKVEKVLVEEKLDVRKEFYVGVIVNDSYKVKAPVVMFSSEGGVEIEEIAAKSPEKISSLIVDIFRGVRVYDGYNLALKVGVPNELLADMGNVIKNTYEVFRSYEARTVEINPLVLTADRKIVAADTRIVIDDSAVPRHPELGIEIAREGDRPPSELDRIAWKIEESDYRGVAYFMQMVPEIKEQGYVGYHGIGGGGALLGADALFRHGLKIANYADTSGNPTASKVYRIAKLILSQPGIEGYFLAGACVASQDQWHHAHALVKAFREDLKDRPGFPVIVLLAGNKEKEALEILKQGLKDLPIRLELYGREHVYQVDFLAERMKAMVEEYRRSKR